MGSYIKKGETILIPFRNGQSITDSQLKPRIYKTKEAFEKHFPGHYLGKKGVELVEYAELVRCMDCFANGCCSVQDALKMGDEGYCIKGVKREQVKIDALEFSTRTYNCLKRAGIDTVGKLLNKTDGELMKIRCFGEVCLAEVHKKIEKHDGVTITPAVPGPSEADPNIMELCFRNGERNMKEKVITMLQDILDQEDGLCLIDLSEVIKAVEDL